MNIEILNESYADVISTESEMNRLAAPYREALEVCKRIEDQREAMSETWYKQVIDIGNALIESRRQYGAEWDQDFDSLGYGFSYFDACRYIVVAKDLDLGDTTATLEAVDSSEMTDKRVRDNYDCLDHATQ